MRKVLFSILVVLLAAAFAISAFLVGSYLLEGKEQKEKYDQLSEMVANAQTQSTETLGEGETAPSETVDRTITLRDEDGMLLCYKNLYEMNNDMVGWLKISGTQLDYPVMQTPDDNEFYLDKDFDKEKSVHIVRIHEIYPRTDREGEAEPSGYSIRPARRHIQT